MPGVFIYCQHRFDPRGARPCIWQRYFSHFGWYHQRTLFLDLIGSSEASRQTTVRLAQPHFLREPRPRFTWQISAIHKSHSRSLVLPFAIQPATFLTLGFSASIIFHRTNMSLLRLSVKSSTGTRDDGAKMARLDELDHLIISSLFLSVDASLHRYTNALDLCH